MIRPWHRSRLFWLGLPGLVFLLWAWGHSNFQETIAIDREPARIEIASGHGHVLFSHLSAEADFQYAVDRWKGIVYPRPWPVKGMISCWAGPMPAFSIHQEPVPPVRRTWFPPFRFQSGAPVNADFLLIAVPHWFIVVFYLAAWSGFFAWWQWRKARIIRRAAAGSLDQAGTGVEDGGAGDGLP